jgi:hypothetical protein
VTEKKRTCKDCVYFWRDGSGYSDWTWMETSLRCFLGVHPNLPMEEPYEGDPKELDYASSCSQFEDASYDGEPVLISPDGHLDKGSDRAAAIIRKLAK